MPSLLKYGLIAIGSGVALCLVGVATGGIAMCSGTPLGGVEVVIGLCLVPTGILLCITAGVVALFKRKLKPAA